MMYILASPWNRTYLFMEIATRGPSHRELRTSLCSCSLHSYIGYLENPIQKRESKLS